MVAVSPGVSGHGGSRTALTLSLSRLEAERCVTERCHRRIHRLIRGRGVHGGPEELVPDGTAREALEMPGQLSPSNSGSPSFYTPTMLQQFTLPRSRGGGMVHCIPHLRFSDGATSLCYLGFQTAQEHLRFRDLV